MHHPTYPRIGEAFRVDLMVYNYRDDEVTNYILRITSNRSDIKILDDTSFIVTPEEAGYDEIFISVEKFGTKIVSGMNFQIVIPVASTYVEMDSLEVPIDTEKEFQIHLLTLRGRRFHGVNSNSTNIKISIFMNPKTGSS